MTAPPVVPEVIPSAAPATGGDSTRALIVIALGILVLYLILRAKPSEAAKPDVKE